MRKSVALGLGVVLVTALGSQAMAKTKTPPPAPSCNLLTDPKGDSGVTPFPNEDIMDIVSADVATNATTVTAVLRLSKYAANDAQTAYGKRYIVSFKPGAGDGMYLTALDLAGDTSNPLTAFNFGQAAPDPTTGQLTYTSKGSATGVFDAAKSEIRISAAVADIATAGLTKITPGMKLTQIGAATFHRVGNQLFDADTGAAPTKTSYTAGAPSCVVVGQ